MGGADSPVGCSPLFRFPSFLLLSPSEPSQYVLSVLALVQTISGAGVMRQVNIGERESVRSVSKSRLYLRVVLLWKS